METDTLLATGSINVVPQDYGANSGSAEHGHPDNGSPGFGTRSTNSVGDNESCPVKGGDEALYMQQAVVFIEDAIHYRSINHRVDASSLRLHRWYYSRLCQWGLGLAIAVVLLLAFVEQPSSLSTSSDPRYRLPPWEPPCGLTEGIEALCLFVFTLDLAVKSYLIGWEEFRKSKWLMGYTVVITASIIDWMLSISMECDEKLRVRRLLRPFFLLQNSSLMKKTLKCIKRTLPEIASVILLLALHLCLFTMIGMLLFAKTDEPERNGEWGLYFRNLPQAITSLLVLLTTANNPDVMIPAYTLNRAYSIFFITFSVFGTYFLMNLLTAIIYNQFRGYLMMSVQTSILRRRLGIRAAFQVLRCQGTRAAVVEQVRVDTVLEVMYKVNMKSYYRAAIIKEVQQRASDVHMDHKAFGTLFEQLDKDRVKEHPAPPQYNYTCLQKIQFIFSHYYTTLAGNAVALANVICICTILVLNAEKSTAERNDYYLEVINCCFIFWYLLEMSLKLLAFGLKGYLSYRNNIFDGFLTILLMVLQITILINYSVPFSKWQPISHAMSLWDMVRLINLLIVFRFLRIIPDIKLMNLVASTLLDLVKNLRAFAGILVVVFYVFAVFGIWLFEGAIKPPTTMSIISNSTIENITSNYTTTCGTYEQLEYWPNNFDDFAAAIILLYNVMVVNNWQAFMDAYSRYTTEWAKVYFVCWWLTSSVMWVNLFVALILENFIYKWDRSHSCSVTDMEKTRYETSVQLMFKEHIEEPTEEELLRQLQQHPHLRIHCTVDT
ncbi:two pore channel protein 2 [Gadus chalcogrammus]|uniref:two pore channel protein 2 n=1 Tax=Gadus chalcogrammus TaxID=1042646 RepID=UPI0024C4C2D5|nr:two pore channel protein 2 [Gadus chalcogrammus]